MAGLQGAPREGYLYSGFCEHSLHWAGKLSVTIRQTHRPGDKLFVDNAGNAVSITDCSTGEIREASIFVTAIWRLKLATPSGAVVLPAALIVGAISRKRRLRCDLASLLLRKAEGLVGRAAVLRSAQWAVRRKVQQCLHPF